MESPNPRSVGDIIRLGVGTVADGLATRNIALTVFGVLVLLVGLAVGLWQWWIWYHRRRPLLTERSESEIGAERIEMVYL